MREHYLEHTTLHQGIGAREPKRSLALCHAKSAYRSAPRGREGSCPGSPRYQAELSSHDERDGCQRSNGVAGKEVLMHERAHGRDVARGFCMATAAGIARWWPRSGRTQ